MTEAGDPQGGAPPWLLRLAEAAARMPVPEWMRPPEGEGRPSAVLILFGEGGPTVLHEGPDVLLIQRSQGLRRHAGQPAFPGGALDSCDAGPAECALREAAEETALDPGGVRVLTSLPEIYIPPSGFRVTPVLAWWQRPTRVIPADTEVAAVARVPVAELVDPGNRVQVRVPGAGLHPGFRVRGMTVWGFTAGLLTRILALGGWERPWLTGETPVVDVVAGP